MTYLDLLAGKIKQQIPPNIIPNESTASLFRLYAVLALAKGTAVEAGDVHNAWAAWMQERHPDHHAIVPFEDLDPETQSFDEPFAQAIRVVAAQPKNGAS